MDVSVGDKVIGEQANGIVVAMTNQWCIYRTENGLEIPETWETIEVPTTPESKTPFVVTSGGKSFLRIKRIPATI